MPKDKEEYSETAGCKCPNCGCPLMVVQGEGESNKNLGDMDEEGQRNVMENDFKKRMGKDE